MKWTNALTDTTNHSSFKKQITHSSVKEILVSQNYVTKLTIYPIQAIYDLSSEISLILRLSR